MMIFTLMFITCFQYPTATMKGSIEYQFPVDDCVVKVYKIAEIDDQNKVIYDEDFKGANIALDVTNSNSLNACSNVLQSYIQANQMKADFEMSVKNKVAYFDNLNKGIYFIDGSIVKSNDQVYKPMCTLVVLPYTNENHQEVYDVVIKGKYEVETYEPDKTISIKVMKVWDDKGNEKNRPKQISVQLLCDDFVYDQVVLNESNDWSYEWKQLENHHVYNIHELDQNAYLKQIEKKENMIVLKNIYTVDQDGDIPQTGQLWIPALVLAFLGVIFVGLGIVVGKSKNSYE